MITQEELYEIIAIDENYRIELTNSTGDMDKFREVFQRRNANSNETTQKTTQKILELMKQKPTISTVELAELCGLTRDGVNYNIRKLKAQGVVCRLNGRKGGYWKVMK